MLTNDAKKLLYALYTEYKARRAVGSPRSDAKYFHSAESIQENFLPDWILDDVEDTLFELEDAGLVEILRADNTITECFISDAAIATAEKQSSDVFASALDFVAKFVFPLFPNL